MFCFLFKYFYSLSFESKKKRKKRKKKEKWFHIVELLIELQMIFIKKLLITWISSICYKKIVMSFYDIFTRYKEEEFFLLGKTCKIREFL